jgi:ABC-2 type transport system permease protein
MRARERLLGLVVLVPGLLIFSGLSSVMAFVGVRTVLKADPDGLLPALSLFATFVGIFWAASPLLSGVALTETHDLSRLLHFPVPLPVLVASSLLANLAQPLVLAELPIVVAVAAALADGASTFPVTLLGVGASFVLMLACAQLVGLLLHGASRRRRLHDLSIFLGLAVGFGMSLLPLLLLSGGLRASAPFLHRLLTSDVAVLSPFGWGVRAAAHAGQGQTGPAASYAALALLAIGAVAALSSVLVGRVYRGEMDSGIDRASALRPARMPFAGPLGALVEKDLRSAWRDPALKASLFMGLVGPLVFVALLSRGTSGTSDATPLLLLALFLGSSGYGANAFGLERRGIALLLSLPVDRWRILVAKNLGSLALRTPGLLTLCVATLLLASPRLLPATLAVALVVLICAAGVDNFASILLAQPLPEAGRNPWSGSAAGTRGLTGALMSLGLLIAALGLAAPFAFLAWLPLLLEQPGLWAVTIPLALAGALSVYAMLVAAAAGLLQRREPELLERMLGDA